MSPVVEKGLRIKARAARMWFVLGGLLLVIAIIAATTSAAPAGVVGTIGALGVGAVTYGIFWARQWVAFGDEIVVGYVAREEHIRWQDVVFISFDEEHPQIPTGIPFLGIPTTNHTMTLTLKGDRTLSLDIDPNVREAVSIVVLAHARLDAAAEYARREHADLSERRSDTVIAAVFGFALFGICAFFFTLIGLEVSAGLASLRWPAAEGTVTRAAVETEVSGQGERQSVRYLPVVEYRYSVGGREYCGSRLGFSPQRSSDRQAIDALMVDLKAGGLTRVHYDPDAPRESVLNPGVPQDRYIGLGILAIGGLASIAFGLINARRLVRRDFAPRPSSFLAQWGTPIAVLAVIIAFGIKVALFFQEHPLPKETSPAPEVDIYEWATRESRLKEILAFQRARGISDEQLDAVLKQVWTESYPDRSPPWPVVPEGASDWWRITVDWDVELVKQRLLDPDTKRGESADE